MQIANPIYDTFFKFLLEDTNLAKKLLSAVIEEDIISLEFRPQEFTVTIPQKYLSVLRVDFKAIIRTPDGSQKKILIEMQKTKLLFDVMRFRKYLADNYGRQDEFVSENGNVKEILPIVTIYFLNFKLPTVGFPLLKIARNYTNLVTKEVENVKDEFIEQLTHDCYAIQIPRLRLNMQNRVEKLLSIFNQKYVTTTDNKIMNLPHEWNQDEELKAFIERLNQPLQDEQMVRQAEAEDEIETKFDEIEREFQKKLEEVKAQASQENIKLQQEKAEAEQENIKLQQEKAEAEQEKVKLQQEKAEAEEREAKLQQEKMQLEQEKESAINEMLLAKIPVEKIAIFLNVSIDKIITLKNK
jgi:hypothetical protein